MLALIAGIAISTPVIAQGWAPGPYLTQAVYSCPPFVFVSMPKAGGANHAFGTDAHPDTNRGELDLGSPGRKLWYMHRLLSPQEPILLFPLPGHASLWHRPPNFMAPPLENGSVHEPTVWHHAEKGRYWVIFSFAIDLVAKHITKPCDLFAIDITDAVVNPQTFTAAAAANLPVKRLTDATLGLNDQNEVETALYDRSFNPDLMQQWGSGQGVYWYPFSVYDHFETNTGACVVDEEQGPVLYWASNQRRTDGEGLVAGDLFYNETAQPHPVIELKNRREIQHFNTTSVISFFESPRGAAGSYRSSTKSTDQWGIFEYRSDDAQWQTISGYANHPQVADHNGTTIAIGDDPEDSLLVISRYYVDHNESFGTVIVLPYRDVGLNFDSVQAQPGGKDAFVVKQLGAFNGTNRDRSLFPDMFQNSAWSTIPSSGNSEEEDYPSSSGKFAHPAGGRKSNSASTAELFLTYSDDPSHGNYGYDAKLVAVTGLHLPISPSGSSYLPSNPRVQLVLESSDLHCFAMKPVLTHNERFGWKHRKVMPRLPKANCAGFEGWPVAQVTAGPIYNTDVKPMTRRHFVSSNDFWDPTVFHTHDTGRMFARVACLTKDLGVVSASDVWGIRIMLTDAKVRRVVAWSPTFPMSPQSQWGYLHHISDGGASDFGGAAHFERYRHLSDVPMDSSGKVNFLLPANVPVKFFLLHQDGTVLAAHRNHHSFAPGQLENRCTGCHQHVNPTQGPAQADGTPFDTLTQTGKWEWTPAFGRMRFNIYPVPSLPVPEFKADIWPLLSQGNDCRPCHDSLNPHPNPALRGTSKFDLSMNRDVGGVTLDQEVAIWAFLNNKQYVNRDLGAAKSPLAWHFYGVASDIDARLDGETNVRYKPPASPNSRYWITTYAGGQNPHSGVDRIKAQKVIEWIDAGAAIDHNNTWYGPPENGGVSARRGVNGDGYQIALSAHLDWSLPTNLIVGYWDAFGNDPSNRISTVKVTVRNVTFTHGPTGNGTHVFDLSSVGPIDPLDNVVVEAVDAAKNRSVIQKTIRQLLLESEPHRGEVTMTPSDLAYSAGGELKFGINAPAHAGQFYLVMMSGGGIHPGYDATGLNLGLYLVPNLDAYLMNSIFATPQGPLTVDGFGEFVTPTPGGVPPIELYCQALVFTAGGLGAKSNIEAIKIQ